MKCVARINLRGGAYPVIGGSLGSLCLASTARSNAVVVLWPGPMADPRQRFLPDSCVQGSRDVVDRRLLGLADFLTVLPVSSCDFVGQRDDEPAIFVDLCRRGLALKQSDRITQVLQSVLLELLGRVIVRVIPLRFGRDDLIQKFALAVLLARLYIGLGHGDGLAKRAPSLGGDHEHSSNWWRF